MVVVVVMLVLLPAGAQAGVEGVVVGALADEDQVVEAEVAAEGYCGRGEGCEEGACCGVWRGWSAWVMGGETQDRGDWVRGEKGQELRLKGLKEARERERRVRTREVQYVTRQPDEEELH